ncbi:alpha/beta hydrolase [Pedobacter frigiditerrae]|uniref:alpha/beta fold hydrolase n=1 Tax=Pedobacter frigiditerrae TaxID=2530452 RepID=UPI002931276E|nr:alpha/beta hydrolase [Pedobacter frigiditerrae]
MKQLLLISSFLFCISVVSAQSTNNLLNPKIDDYNLDFENLIPNTNKAQVWFTKNKTNEISIETDTVQRYTGKRSLLIENANDKPLIYLQSGIFIPSKYEGKEIEIRFHAKFKDVVNHVDFIMRTNDEDNDLLQFTNSLKKRIFGSSDWKEYIIKLPLQPETRNIWFWPTLYGSGKLWIDNVKIIIDGKDISLAKVKENYNPNVKPVNYGQNSSTGKKVKVTDAEIYYEIYGEGEPLLLLHGNSQSIKAFKKQIKEFAKFYQVVAVDTRGQGNSTDLRKGNLSYNLYADDMKTLLDSLKIKKANIVGWSDGGNTGLIMASKYQSYVNKLAVTGACTNPKTAVSENTLNEVRKAIEALRTNKDEKSKYQVKLFTMLLTEPNITSSDLKNIKAKVLVMAGEKDMILETQTKFIADNISNSKSYIFKNASHDVPFESAKEFNEVVLNFLKMK